MIEALKAIVTALEASPVVNQDNVRVARERLTKIEASRKKAPESKADKKAEEPEATPAAK